MATETSRTIDSPEEKHSSGAQAVLIAFRRVSLGAALIALLGLSAAPAPAYEGERVYSAPAVRPAVQDLHIAQPRSGRLYEAPKRILVYFQRFEQGLQGSSLELWIDGVEYTEQLGFWTDRAWLDLPPGFVWTPGTHVVLARVQDATGSPIESLAPFELGPPLSYIWPFDYATPNVVANLMEDYQHFSLPAPYWHHGVDLRAPDGSPVRAAIGGYVAYAHNYPPYSSLQWNVTILGDDDLIWQYSHIEQSDVQAWQVGDRVEQGDVLGHIVSWPVTETGALYHHLHLNVTEHESVDPIAWRDQLLDEQTPDPAPVPRPLSDGYRWHNPLIFLGNAGDVDTVPPSQGGDDPAAQPQLYYLQNDTHIAMADGDAVLPDLQGDIDVVARIKDERDVIPGLPQPQDGGQAFLLGAYDVGWSVVPVETPCGLGYKPRTSLGPFDEVPGGYDGALQDLLLLDVFQRYVVDGGATYDTEFDWDLRNLHYNVTNSFYGVLDGEKGFWNTDGATIQGPLFPNGTYRVRVYAEDFLGNELVRAHDVRVDNQPQIPLPGFCPNRVLALDLQEMELHPAAGGALAFDPPPVPLELGPIVEGSAHATIPASQWPAWHFDDPTTGLRIAIGLLPGDEVEVEYVPYLGDVILEIPAEAQAHPLVAGGPSPEFDPTQPSSNPVHIRLSTRLARRPDNAQALIGSPAMAGASEFSLVAAEPVAPTGVSYVLLSDPDGTTTFTVPEPGYVTAPPGIALIGALARRRRRSARSAPTAGERSSVSTG